MSSVDEASLRPAGARLKTRVVTRRRILSAAGTVAPFLLVAIGLGLRIYGYNFDDGQLLHPDELAIDSAVTTLGCCAGNHQVATWPSPLSHFFESGLAPYNPHFFNYGSLPLYLLALVTRGAAKVGSVAPGLSSWQSADDLVHTNWIGRWMSALFDAGSLVALYRLGRQVFDSQIAILALAFGTFSVLEIQLSHFYAVDTVLTFFVLLTLLAAVHVVRTNSRRWYVVAGASLGAALATKTSAAPVLLPLFAAPLLQVWKKSTWETRDGRRVQDWLNRYRSIAPLLNANLGWLLISLIVTIAVFAICEPYGIIDHHQLLSDVQTQNGIIVTHAIPVPYTIQFTNTTPYLYFLKNVIVWYLGPALGVTAVVATLWLLLRNAFHKFESAQFILLLWVLPYFILTGRFWAKFDRYMLPILPLLSLFAAAFLLLLYRQMPRRWRIAGRLSIAIVTGCTILWAAAFMHIYTVTNPQIAASNWIYTHIKPGTPFATEGAWDRSLPFCTYPRAGDCPAGYQSYQLNLYSPDVATKVQRLVYALTHDHYIVMSTQRFIDSIPREPSVYPITTRYYQLLFHNRLNFRLIRRFAVHPQLGPWVIDDFPADENFTVFDHPDVRIFARTGPISPARVKLLLTRPVAPNLSLPQAAPVTSHISGGIAAGPRLASEPRVKSQPPVQGVRAGESPASSASHATPQARGLPPIDATRHHQDKRLMLTPTQWREDQQAPTYDQMFPPHGFGMSHPVLVWLLLVELLGLAAFPLAFSACRGLVDRGWIIGKTLGVLAAGWLVWVTVATGWLRYTPATIWTLIALLVAVGGLLWWTQRHAILAFLRARPREVLICEAIFLLGFGLFVLLRMWYPDLGHQFSPVSATNVGAGRMGEKQMELAFLNAISRSQTFPPADPFFAGGYINYYYFGYLVVATLCKATFIAPSVGFNLAIPMFFGLFSATAYSIGRTLTRSVRFGLLTTLFVACLGNLNGLVQLVGGLQSTASIHWRFPLFGGIADMANGAFQVIFSGRQLPPFDFWQSTRLVPPVGTDFAEFPYFTYLFGDLHAHLMAFPMTLAIVGISLSLALSLDSSHTRHVLAALVVVAFILGAIEATNSLDIPAYVCVLAIGVAAGCVLKRRSQKHSRSGENTAPSSTRQGVKSPGGLVGRNARESLAIPGTATLTMSRARVTLRPRWSVGGSVGLLPHRQDPMGTHLGHVTDALRGVLFALIALGLALVLFPPIIQGYHPVFNTGIATVSSAISEVRLALMAQQPSISSAQLSQAVHGTIVTPIGTYWEIFGLFLFLALSWLVLMAHAATRSINGNLRTPAVRGWIGGLICASGGIVVLLILNLYLLAFLLLTAMATMFALIRSFSRLPTRVLWIGGILLLPVALTAFSEIFFIPDFLSSGLAFRMNTVAKLYNDIWVLLAIAGATSLAFLVRVRRENDVVDDNGSNSGRFSTAWLARRVVTRVWIAVLAILVFGSLIYDFSGTIARETYRQTWLPENSVPLTLNGMAFMKVAYPGDFAGINWLNAHVHGMPVIVEADQAYYNWRSRVVQFSGLPTLLGGIHEPEQRYGSEVAPRQRVLEEIYSATSSDLSSGALKAFEAPRCATRPSEARCLATTLLRDYHVSYVYVGLMERQLWPQGMGKFGHMRSLRRVFHHGDVSIYHVNGSPA